MDYRLIFEREVVYNCAAELLKSLALTIEYVKHYMYSVEF